MCYNQLIMQEISPVIMPETKNKTFVMVSAILLISIAVIIAIFFNKNRPDQELTEDTMDQEQQEVIVDLKPSEEGEALLFADLFANRQGSYFCQIENEDGTYYYYYFDEERLAIEAKEPNSHNKTIVDRDFIYNWNVGETVGTKVSNQEDIMIEDLDQEVELTDEEMMEVIPEEDLLPAEDIGPFDPSNFVCRVWEVDESVFTPPSDVMFQDLSQLQEMLVDFEQ